MALFLLEPCRIGSVDGFIVESVAGLGIGILWLTTLGRVTLRSLQDTPAEDWKIPRPAKTADFSPLATELVRNDGLVMSLMRRTTENISSID